MKMCDILEKKCEGNITHRDCLESCSNFVCGIMYTKVCLLLWLLSNLKPFRNYVFIALISKAGNSYILHCIPLKYSMSNAYIYIYIYIYIYKGLRILSRYCSCQDSEFRSAMETSSVDIYI